MDFPTQIRQSMIKPDNKVAYWKEQILEKLVQNTNEFKYHGKEKRDKMDDPCISQYSYH